MKQKLPEGVVDVLVTYKNEVFSPLVAKSPDQYDHIIKRILNSDNHVFFSALNRVDSFIKGFVSKVRLGDIPFRNDIPKEIYNQAYELHYQHSISPFLDKWQEDPPIYFYKCDVNRYLSQWKIFLTVLLSNAFWLNKEAVDDWKSNKNKLTNRDRGKLKAIADTAKKLERLIHEANSISWSNGFYMREMLWADDLLLSTDVHLDNAEGKDKKIYYQSYKHISNTTTSIPLESLIREIALQAEKGEVSYLNETTEWLTKENNKNNIFINSFMKHLNCLTNENYLPPKILNLTNAQWY